MIQGGAGTFLGRFLSPGTNRRQDQWGGCLENRIRLVLHIIDRIHEAAGRDLILEFRMSGAEFLPDGYTIEEGVKIAKALDGKVDIIYVEAGMDVSKDLYAGKFLSMGIMHGSNTRLVADRVEIATALLELKTVFRGSAVIGTFPLLKGM